MLIPKYCLYTDHDLDPSLKEESALVKNKGFSFLSFSKEVKISAGFLTQTITLILRSRIAST